MTREQATEEIKRFMDDYEGEESDILEALDFALADMGTLQEIMDTVKGVMEE